MNADCSFTLLKFDEQQGDNVLIRTLQGICRQRGDVGQQWEMHYSNDQHKRWIHLYHENLKGIEQGWKLHVSADTHSATTILTLVVPLLFDTAASFKFVSSLRELVALNQGAYGLSQIGKFMTIYPPCDQQAVRLAETIDRMTQNLSGPTILSDRPINRGSRVHYRYGGFQYRHYIQEANGSISPAIKTPGNEFVPDSRKTHYEAPSWANDPFVAARLSTSNAQPRPRILKHRYLVTHTVAASPTHTISLALDMQAMRSCILKGPGVAWEDTPVSSDIDRGLLNEVAILNELDAHEHVPKLYECFEYNGHPLLVIEDVQGDTLTDIVSTCIRSGKPVSPDTVIQWGKQVARILHDMHERRLIHADVKPSNIVVDAAGKVYLIDFEHAHQQGYTSSLNYGTRGYISPERQRGLPLSVADDVYSFGALLYFVVTGADPSLAPRSNALLERPPECFSDAGNVLKDIIARCLDVRPEHRYASMLQLIEALEHVETPAFTATYQEHRSEGAETPFEEVEQQEQFYALSRDLLETLSREACYVETMGGKGAYWISRHPLTSGLATCDLNTGNAGSVLALAELVAAHPSSEQQMLLRYSTHWLFNTSPPCGQGLPGLYIGKSGVGAALLRAGQVLREDALIEKALSYGKLVATLPYESPDIFHGSAGRLRFHLFLWYETGDHAQLQAACTCAEHILSTLEEIRDEQCCWIIPDGYGSISGKAFLGYAHGAAGIGDSLLDIFEATGHRRYREGARKAARWLEKQAVASSSNACEQNIEKFHWPVRSGEEVTSSFWCHGSAGIGRFFLHMARYDSRSLELAMGAARAAAEDVKWAGPTQCHGLSGNIEFLLDMYLSTGQQRYKQVAFRLARLLRAFASTQNGYCTFSSDVPSIYTPDYMVGYAGVALCLLRLGMPEQIPHQLSCAGFRHNSRGYDCYTTSLQRRNT